MACMDYVGTVHRVDNAEPLAPDPEPLPPQRSRLYLLSGRHPPGGGLLDGRGCGRLPQTWEARRLGVVLHRPIVGVAHFTSEYATYALLAAPGSLPAAEAAAWIYSWVWVPGLGFIVFLPRLYDIDILINRTLVYGTLTATLVVLYLVGIVVLQRLFVFRSEE